MADYDDFDEQAYEDDLAAQNAVEDAKYDFPPQEEPPEGYYDNVAAEWSVHVYDHADNPILLYSDETPELEGETELTEETAWAIATAINLLGAKMLDEDGDPFLSAAVLHWDEPMDHRSGGVRVGSVSPTEPADLGAWLRALPLRTILTDRDGNACQIDTGDEHIYRAPNRHFPALVIAGHPYEITEGHDEIDALAKWSGPFTVLKRGSASEDGS